jgi:hypothetical protein
MKKQFNIRLGRTEEAGDLVCRLREWKLENRVKNVMDSKNSGFGNRSLRNNFENYAVHIVFWEYEPKKGIFLFVKN